MKKIFYAFAALAAAMTLSVSCDPDMTDEEKKEAADNFTKVLLAGEYGVISVTETNPEADNGNGFGEDELLYEDGKPRMVWVFNLDGTQYLAFNRVWKKRITTGTWDVSETTLVTKVDDPDAPESTFEIVSFENDLLTLQTKDAKIVLKRLSDTDKYPQLQSVEFAHNLANDGKLYIDPRIELNATGTYELKLKYDPEDYEPFDDVSWESSNPEVATVVDGYLRPAEGVTSGETTITVSCDYLEASITVVLQVVN